MDLKTLFGRTHLVSAFGDQKKNVTNFFLFQLAEIGVFDRVDQHETRLNNLEKTNICILSKDPGNCKGTIPR